MTASGHVTHLFTDIEGSTRLWEQNPARMRLALASHDALARAAVERHRGSVVKMTGDGVHAWFDDTLPALRAALEIQHELDRSPDTACIPLRVRCGLHAGVDERRDNDFFGVEVNRAARIMSVAHGGQVLLSHAVAEAVRDRLPEDVALRDLGSVRLKDLASPERVYQVIHPQLRDTFPALRSLEATPNNLARQVTSFIGRERELTEVEDALCETRLLTLLGAGGIGKTRLSLHAAADVLDNYPDGVWFVELAPIADGALVPQAIASVLGVQEEAGRPVLEAVVKCVRDRRLLLVLDNCEHLVQACAEVAVRLLQAGPGVSILASSREPLRVRGEATYAVPRLSVPLRERSHDVAAIGACEAVRLFVDRARAGRHDFTVTARNASPIAEICQRLDGIPLAIELAAARVRTLSVESIAARLDDRFSLLTVGDRTALPRQQTLRALIDWSYDLLSETERALFRRLSVFSGGWTLEAAEAVGAAAQGSAAPVLDTLSELVDKSLVTLDAEGNRYQLLESVREYALERLAAGGEIADARTRHLAFYLDLAERTGPRLFGAQQAEALSRLDLERENLLAAHGWCDSLAGGAETGMRLLRAVKPYWFNRGLLGLGHRVTGDALRRAGAQTRNMARCRLLADAGELCSFMGRYAEGYDYLAEGLSIAREIDHRELVARILQPLGLAALGQGDLAGARACLEEALALAREVGEQRELAAAYNALAQLHRMEGDLETAEPLYREVLALARALSDRDITAIALLNLAMVSIGRGTADRCQGMLLEALAIADEIGSRPAVQSVLEVCAGLCAQRAHWDCAARFFGMAEAQMQQTGLKRDPTDEAFLRPLMTKVHDALDANAFALAEQEGRALTYPDAIDAARTWLGTQAIDAPA